MLGVIRAHTRQPQLACNPVEMAADSSLGRFVKIATTAIPFSPTMLFLLICHEDFLQQSRGLLHGAWIDARVSRLDIPDEFRAHPPGLRSICNDYKAITYPILMMPRIDVMQGNQASTKMAFAPP